MQSRVGKNENTAADWSAWASVPWSPVRRPETETETETATDPGATPGLPNTPIGWLKSGIPYLPPKDAVALQTLDVWIPATNNTTTAPDPSSPPPNPPNKTWIIYIHGGAWRDPAITSTSFTPAATNLLLRSATTTTTTTTTTTPNPPLKSVEPGLAGLVSLNYRLSPHPAHPPCTPADAASRRARHPAHVADVRAALAFLGRLGIVGGGGVGGGVKGGVGGGAVGVEGSEKGVGREGYGGRNWVLAGHSCGATLAFQAVMDPARWGLSPAVTGFGEGGGAGQDWHKPAALVGFNGLYDLAGFIAAPPKGYVHLRDGYREFVEGAFGADERVWRGVCPATVEGRWVGEWIGHEHVNEDKREKTVVLVQSREDTLVPWEQLEAMRARLADEGRVRVEVMEATGNHDDVWREGGRMAEVLWNVLGEL